MQFCVAAGFHGFRQISIAGLHTFLKRSEKRSEADTSPRTMTSAPSFSRLPIGPMPRTTGFAKQQSAASKDAG